MKIESTTVRLDAKGESGVIDITPDVEAFVARAGIEHGQITLFCMGTTGTVTTMEGGPGAVADLQRVLERLVPQNESYARDDIWGDGCGYSAVRASLLKPGLTIPVLEGKPTLGTGQHIMFLPFDDAPRQHALVLQVIGDSLQVRDPSIDLG